MIRNRTGTGGQVIGLRNKGGMGDRAGNKRKKVAWETGSPRKRGWVIEVDLGDRVFKIKKRATGPGSS